MSKLITQFITFLFIFCIQLVFGQSISGRVLELDDRPIPYATVQISDNYGVLTNEEGQFVIDTKNFKSTDIVTISYLGFKKITLSLKDFESKDYYLDEAVNELSEITVSNKSLSVEEIIQKIKENANTNYTSDHIKQQVFQRSTLSNKFKRFEFDFVKSNLVKKKALKKLNKSIDSIIKTSLDISSKNYTEILSHINTSNKKTKLEVVKATRLINKKNDKSQKKFQDLFISTIAKHLEKGATYKVKTGLFKIEDSLDIDTDFKSDIYKDKEPLSALKKKYSEVIYTNTIHEASKLDFIFETKKYNYELKGVSTVNDEKIYIIAFTPKKRSAKFEGVFYVNAYDFAVIKTNFKFAKNKIGKKLNLKMLFGFKYVETIKNVEILFQKNNNGLYSLKLIKQEVGNYVYFNRSFKFTKNRESKSEERKMLKINLLMEMNTLEKEELFFINENELSESNFDAIDESETYKIEYLTKYKPEIWKTYNILSPIEAIKNYDTGE
jgi:hypothetical protein